MKANEAPEKIYRTTTYLDNFCQSCKNLQEEPVSEIDFEQELYKAFGQVKDFTLGMRIAKRFYDMGRNHQEPVSEGLEEAADNALNNVLNTHDIVNVRSCLEMFRFGADWQKQQMMANAIDGEVLENYDGKVLEYDDSILDKKLSNCRALDKVKIIIIKED